MTSGLKADVKEYIPLWAQKKTASTNLAAPPSLNTRFTTSMTSTNIVTTHSKTTGAGAALGSQSPHALAALPLRGPTTSLRIPTRMSPIHAPFPSFTSAMNPDAKDFIPHLAGSSPLAALPTSTAELEEQQQQKRHVEPSFGAELAATSATNGVSTPVLSSTFRTSLTPTLAAFFLEKTDEEVLEISRRSLLKAGAPVFIPRRTLNRVMINKPSPFSLTPATGEMRLGDLWCLFYLPVSTGEGATKAAYDPTLVFRVDSVATFWKVFNNVAQPTEMDSGTLYFFRDGINPKWEDPANSDGGILRQRIKSSKIDEAWVTLLCRTIGESWTKSVRNTVNGVVLKVRGCKYVLEIWVTRQSPELMADISELLKQLMGAPLEFLYAPHSVTQERAAAAALAEKKGGNNRRRW